MHRNGKRVAEELGIDPATISRWKNDERWDEQLENLEEKVDEALQVSEIKERHFEKGVDALGIDFEDDEAHWDRAKELAVQALVAIKTGKVQFRSMSEALRAIERFTDLDRVMHGKATEISISEHKFSLAGLSTDDPTIQIKGLVAIMAGADPHAVKEIAEVTTKAAEIVKLDSE